MSSKVISLSGPLVKAIVSDGSPASREVVECICAEIKRDTVGRYNGVIAVVDPNALALERDYLVVRTVSPQVMSQDFGSSSSFFTLRFRPLGPAENNAYEAAVGHVLAEESYALRCADAARQILSAVIRGQHWKVQKDDGREIVYNEPYGTPRVVRPVRDWKSNGDSGYFASSRGRVREHSASACSV